MVGLDDVKDIADQIISSYKMQKIKDLIMFESRLIINTLVLKMAGRNVSLLAGKALSRL